MTNVQIPWTVGIRQAHQTHFTHNLLCGLILHPCLHLTVMLLLQLQFCYICSIWSLIAQELETMINVEMVLSFCWKELARVKKSVRRHLCHWPYFCVILLFFMKAFPGWGKHLNNVSLKVSDHRHIAFLICFSNTQVLTKPVKTN